MSATSITSSPGLWTSSSASSFSAPPSSSFITADTSAPGTFSEPYPQKITNELSGSNQTINTQIVPYAWNDGVERDVPAHLPLFVLRTSKASVVLSYEKSVYALNKFLLEQGRKAREVWLRPSGAGLSEAERKGIVSREEYDDLMRRPTATWMQSDIVKRLLTDERREESKLIRYLFLDGIVSAWNFIGFKPNEDKPMRTTTLVDALPGSRVHAVSFAGHIHSVNNIWGNDVRLFDVLGLSLEPIKSQGKRDGIFLLAPIKSQGKRRGNAFFDVTGSPCYSHIYWIGQIKDWTTRPVVVDQEAVWNYLSLVEGDKEIAERYNPDKSLTIWCHR
jgi:hypothetical protein